MSENRILEDAYTFDDVLLVPLKSDIVPTEARTNTRLTNRIELNIPIISAAMDTVTESRLAIALAQQGGLGVIHKNFSIERQVAEVDKVKRSESGMIVDPITMSPDQKIEDAVRLMAHYKISGVPITENGRLVGILTNRDLRFETRFHLPIREVMTKDHLITAPVGTTLEEAQRILHQHRIEKLLVVDRDGNLKGLITVKDIAKKIKYPLAAKDPQGRLRVAAAVGATGDFLERAVELARVKVDLIVIDTAHGHTSRVLSAVREVKARIPELDVVVGNIATREAARDLIAAGADAIKVGMGPGSICTTRVVSGAGMPQITAILNCAAAARETNTPIIADGGIKFSGDITKALAAGADTVMIGSLFAGTDESPGETILYQGRTFKSYRGMGSIGAMQAGSGDRYGQESEAPAKLVPEGVEGRVPYKGPVAAMVLQLVGGLRAGMGYCGAPTIADLHTRTKFIKITAASLRESHVHDVYITKESPNYQREE
ncbi:MAG TPA: IMP dehydrogenase [Terriglobia bacterium]|nr:IMP dehydrogenase [Terriglobia bacterium]